MDRNPNYANAEFIMKSFQPSPLPREKRTDDSTSGMDDSETRIASGQSNEEIQACSTEEVPISRIRKYTKPKTTSEQSNEGIQGCSTEEVALNRTTEQVATCRIQNPPFSYSVIQVFVLTLMLAWPLIFLCFGIIYIDKCPAQDKLPLVAIMTACVGTLPIVMRVIKIIWLDHLSDVIRRRCRYMLMILEGIFLLFFCPYNAMLFNLNPSYDSSRDDYCSYYFYNLNYKANFFSIAFLILYIGARLVPRIRHWYLRRF